MNIQIHRIEHDQISVKLANFSREELAKLRAVGGGKWDPDRKILAFSLHGGEATAIRRMLSGSGDSSGRACRVVKAIQRRTIHSSPGTEAKHGAQTEGI